MTGIRFKPKANRRMWFSFDIRFRPLRPVGGAHRPELRFEAFGKRSRGRLNRQLIESVSPFNPSKLLSLLSSSSFTGSLEFGAKRPHQRNTNVDNKSPGGRLYFEHRLKNRSHSKNIYYTNDVFFDNVKKREKKRKAHQLDLDLLSFSNNLCCVCLKNK